MNERFKPSPATSHQTRMQPPNNSSLQTNPKPWTLNPVVPLKQVRYGVYGDLSIILVNSVFSLLKGDSKLFCPGPGSASSVPAEPLGQRQALEWVRRL